MYTATILSVVQKYQDHMRTAKQVPKTSIKVNSNISIKISIPGKTQFKEDKTRTMAGTAFAG